MQDRPGLSWPVLFFGSADEDEMHQIAQARLQLQALKDAYLHGVEQIRKQHLKPLASTGAEGVDAANEFMEDTSIEVPHEPFEVAEQPGDVTPASAAPAAKATRTRRKQQ